MPASIFTSKNALLILSIALLLLKTPCAHAAGGSAPGQPEDDDYSTTPYTEYGEFNEDEDEAADTRFYQFGRFFGVSLGTCYEGATGNRGKLWNGGFPGFDVKVHYWFDFNFAMDMGFYTASHNFDAGSILGGPNDVQMSAVFLDLKYYLDTKNLSSGISFVNPYFLGGIGSYTKTQTPRDINTVDRDSRFGVDLGAGLEFAVNPRKVYFSFETKLINAQFKDTNYGGLASQGLGNLAGFFYTFTGAFLFTW